MRILPDVIPTPEQLKILLNERPGVLVVNGAAGTGKTTTALLRLRQLCGSWLGRMRRLSLTEPVRVLVLTYNRTLEGYIAELARHQVGPDPDLELEVLTFGKFARDLVGAGPQPEQADRLLRGFAQPFGLPTSFVTDEVEYLLGRFAPDDLEDYLTVRRDGRGSTPRVETPTRRLLLDEVVYPYVAAKAAAGVLDWNDLAVAAGQVAAEPWDVVVVDEAQDFSANQVRTVLAHVAEEEHSVTFVLDAAQRIYPRAFTWKEVGIGVTSRRLTRNCRNTRQIAALARGLLEGLPVDDDGALPDFDAAETDGPLPNVLVGRFSRQLDWALKYVVEPADLAEESVVFLHPRGGRWFDYLKDRLDTAGVPSVQLSRSSRWPGGDETVALCTIHSAKGLEFDHVLLLGLNQEVTPHSDDEGEAKLDHLRRLVAMGIGRARKTVTVGFKPGAASTLVGLLDPDTYQKVDV